MKARTMATIAPALLAAGSAVATPYDQCGTYMMGLEGCIVFQPDDATLGRVRPDVLRPVGTHARVQGDMQGCVSFCFVPCVVGSVVGECGAPACRANFNGVNGVTVQDIFDFLGAWFAGCTAGGAGACQYGSADFNGVSGLTVQDIFDFLSAWFAGC